MRRAETSRECDGTAGHDLVELTAKRESKEQLFSEETHTLISRSSSSSIKQAKKEKQS